MQNLGWFQTTLNFDHGYLSNRCWYPKLERHVIDSDSFCIRREKSGEIWSTNNKSWTWVFTHSYQVFWKTIFRPLGGAAPSNFYAHATREWPRLASAHPTGDGAKNTQNLAGLRTTSDFWILGTCSPQPSSKLIFFVGFMNYDPMCENSARIGSANR